MNATFERTTFATNRAMEFFTEKELQMQIGYDRAWWPIALVKELIDNALDACETAGRAPEIVITVEDDAVSVLDNGPGLPAAVLERSLDYLVRVSDKNHYTGSKPSAPPIAKAGCASASWTNCAGDAGAQP